MSQMSQCVSVKGNTKPSRVRARRWCYTLNNYTDEEMSQCLNEFKKQKFFVQGVEVGAEGTPHLQGYVEFKDQKDLSALKKINPRIHWEVAKGSKKDNIKYCTKDEVFEKSEEIGSLEWIEKEKKEALERYLKRRNCTKKYTIDELNAFSEYKCPGQ